MPTESTAIVRFISEAQQQAGQPGGMAEPLPPALTEDLRPARRSLRGPLLVAGAIGVIGAATVAGIFIGKHSATQDRAPAPAAAPAPTPAPAAALIPPPSVTPGDPADPAMAPTAQGPAAIAPEVLAETGFDIRIKPPATISLDGRVLGKAPLRIRNLNPGAHVVDIDAPPGYFSRRVEIELDPGEPLNVNLALDPIDPTPAVSEDPADDDRPRRAGKDRRPVRRAASSAPVKAVAKSAAAKGTLMLGSKPPCDIYIDGAPTGLKTPQRAIELTAGTHRITLVNGDLAIKQTFTVEIEAGKSVREVKDLTGKL